MGDCRRWDYTKYSYCSGNWNFDKQFNTSANVSQCKRWCGQYGMEPDMPLSDNICIGIAVSTDENEKKCIFCTRNTSTRNWQTNFSYGWDTYERPCGQPSNHWGWPWTSHQNVPTSCECEQMCRRADSSWEGECLAWMHVHESKKCYLRSNLTSPHGMSGYTPANMESRMMSGQLGCGQKKNHWGQVLERRENVL